MSEYELADGGTRDEYHNGALREGREGKGRFDLISPYFLRRLAAVLEKGCRKYGERNWEKGIPLSRFLDSAFRHLTAVLAGDEGEDHATQAAWNLHSYIHTLEMIGQGRLAETLDDRPGRERKESAPAVEELSILLSAGERSVADVVSKMVSAGYSIAEMITAATRLDVTITDKGDQVISAR